MKYIWNKTKLLEFLDKWVQLTWLKSWLFFDAFSWTWSVGKFFKSKGFDVISNDLMFYSYVEQKAMIQQLGFDKSKNEVVQVNEQFVSFIQNEFLPQYSKMLWFNLKTYQEDAKQKIWGNLIF